MSSLMGPSQAYLTKVYNSTYAGLHVNQRLPHILSGDTKTITTFQSGHGWTSGGLGTSNLNATDDFVFGSQCLSMTTDGSGSGANAIQITRSPSTAFDMTGRQFVLMVKCGTDNTVPGPVRTFTFYAGTAGITDNQTWTPCIQNFDVIDGWMFITLPWGESTTGASGATRNSVDTFRLAATDRGTAVTWHVQGIFSIPEPTAMTNGLVSFTFDDSWASAYTRALPALGRYGYGATTYTIASTIGATGRLTIPNLQTMEGVGWEAAAHAYSEPLHTAAGGYTVLSDSALDTELRSLKAWFDANHLKGGDHFAYPQGLVTDATRAVVRKYFASARQYTNAYLETLPPGSPHFMRSAGPVASTTTASLTAKIDKAYAKNEWLIMTFHDIVASGATGSDYNVADLQTVVNYCATKGIAVRTVGDALKLVS